MRFKHPVRLFILKHRLLLLLAGSFATIIMYAYLDENYPSYCFALELCFYGLVLLGMALVNKQKTMLLVGLTLMILAQTFSIAYEVLQSPSLIFLNLFTNIIYLSLATLIIISHTLEARKITLDKIYGAMSAYLLIGLIWCLLFTILEIQSHGAFEFPHGLQINASDNVSYRIYLMQFLYFSFVNLSTLGYGDIIPVTGIARLFSVTEAIIGQLYVAILIARLVGLHIRHQQ